MFWLIIVASGNIKKKKTGEQKRKPESWEIKTGELTGLF